MGVTPLCVACSVGNVQVALALLDGGAHIDFATPPRHGRPGDPGYTPLIYAANNNHAGVVKLLFERGADGTMRNARAARGIDAGLTALDIARHRANDKAGFAETFAVLRLWCCSTCGVTSSGLSAMAATGGEQHLRRCGNCPARGSSAQYTGAQYCGTECQRADWGRHRGECAEARRAR